MRNKTLFLFAVLILFIAGCGLNSVTKEELENVKPGNVLVYRYYKGSESWFYADKITRIEGDKIYYNAGKMEANKGNDARIRDFVTDKELSMTKADLLKYEKEQPDDKKVIIWIE